MPNDVAVLYDRCMLDHQPRAGHPERPERLSSIVSRLEKNHLWARLKHVAPPAIARDAILRIHDASVVDRAERVSASGGGVLDQGDTVASPGSWKAAQTAAACAVGAVDVVMRGEASAAMALVRPPGHHATPHSSMGFCIFNNIAIAAAHALDTYGLDRVMIIDFDVHHGNGTQDAFYDNPHVLFFSSHQHPAYPGTGKLREIGYGAGDGYTINVPVPAGVGDAGYARIMSEVLVPASNLFQPQLILVSAGYDAHWRNAPYVAGIDERVTIDAFFSMSQTIRAISDRHCPGKLAAILEGGYDLDALGYGVAATLGAWLGDEDFDDPIGPSPRTPRDSEIDPVIAAVRSLHGLS